MGLKDLMVENEVKLDLSEYLLYILGQEKAGKTTLYHEFVKEFYGTPKAGLLIPFENGFKTIKGLNRLKSVVETWSDFVEIVDSIVDDATEAGIKVIAIDTYDKMVEVATREVLRLSKLKDGKKVDTLNEAFSGFGRGKVKLDELISGQVNRLKNAGLCVVVIGHVKYKKLKIKNTGEEYNVMGSNLTEDIHKIIANDADLICMITVEKSISDGVVTGDERFLRFRSTGEYECGGRIKNLPEKIKLDSKLFTQTLKEALSKDAEINEADYDKEVKKQHVSVEKRAEEFKKEDKEEREIKTLGTVTELVDKIQEAFKDEENKNNIITAMQEIACKNFNALREEEYNNVVKVYKAIK